MRATEQPVDTGTIAGKAFLGIDAVPDRRRLGPHRATLLSAGGNGYGNTLQRPGSMPIHIEAAGSARLAMDSSLEGAGFEASIPLAELEDREVVASTLTGSSLGGTEGSNPAPLHFEEGAQLGPNKATELADFSVCTTWGIEGNKLYLLGVLRKRLDYPDLKRAVREQQSLFNAGVILIEDKASGTQLIQELIVDGCHAVTRYKPECDKIMRLHAQTAAIENGFVYVPQTAPWLADYLHEMTIFPKGKHDDQVDSTAQFLDWLKKPMPGWAIFEVYRRRAEELQRQTSC